jgi:predicted RNase H-like HicB family nuclease
MDITFEVIQEIEGSYVAACYSENIYTEGASLEELHANITSAIDVKFRGRIKPSPSAVRLMVFRE